MMLRSPTSRQPTAVAFLAAAVVVSAGSCERGGGAGEAGPARQTQAARGGNGGGESAGQQGLPESVDGPIIPRKGAEWSPSLIQHTGGAPNPETLSEIESCGECHAETVAQWRDSMHAFASFNNPLYRVAFDDFVENRDQKKGRFCAGCHDPVPLFEGTIDTGVEPTQKSAHLGVTCNVCHGIEEATTDGNASFTLRTDAVPVPESADPPSDSKKLEAHRQRVGMTALRTEAMCVSCHRGFLSQATGHDVFILGFDEYAPWRRSGYAGNPATRVDEPVPEQSCVDCHMPEQPDGSHSHRFPGGHSAFAAMLGSEPQLDAVREMIDDVATVDVSAVGAGDERFPTSGEDFAVEPGGRFWVDVVVRNMGVGHNFPGGQRDLRDTWIEVRVEDADGELVAEAGVDHRESGSDPSAHRLRALVLSPEAETQKTHNVAHFRTKAYDHTISTRDAELARYAWTVPERAGGEAVDFPLEVQARLLHRRLSKSFHGEVCEASQSERGQGFLDQTEAMWGVRPEPCAEQPVIEMARDVATIRRDGFELSDAKKPWRRWFERGLAMQDHLSERLDEALDSFRRAETALKSARRLEAEAKKQWRAMIEDGRARVLARQRRNEEAVAAFDDAEEQIGPHPAIFVGRGDAYANVWRFDEAVEEYRAASERVDGDRIWRKLAIGLGSLGQHRDSLVAAQKGLAIEPRDPDLLRSQMIALRKLDAPEAWQKQASEAFGRFKRDEKAHLLQAECADRSEICEMERLPVHTHELQPPE